MALYRTVSTSFWMDSKVIDDFTKEDRYFYLYLFTNPHTNLAGCYETSMAQMILETGFTKEEIAYLLIRFEKNLCVLKYSKDTKEVLLLNWYKYNWTSSAKFRKPLLKEIDEIKNQEFKEYLMDKAGVKKEVYGIDTVSDEEKYGMDTSSSYSSSYTSTNTISNNQPSQKEYDEIISLWNAVSHTMNIDEIIPLSRRDNELRICISHYGMDGIRKGIKKIEESKWLQKQGRVSFDTFMKLDTFQKLMEGAYDEDFRKGGKTDGFELGW